MSPASPENAINVFLFSCLVLSSVVFRIVAPLIAAFEAAMMVKSFPVMPSKTSLILISSLLAGPPILSYIIDHCLAVLGIAEKGTKWSGQS